MDRSLPFFNWSLKKALDTETDNLAKARLGILFALLIFSILKAVVAIVTAVTFDQHLQVVRACVAFVLYIILTKLLLFRPSAIKKLTHVMIIFGMMIVWSSVFIFHGKINLPMMQFVFMIILGGFYLLGGRTGMIYSILGSLPVIFLLLFGNKLSEPIAEQLASPGMEIIAILNFVTIIVSHYLFYKAFLANLREKEVLNEQLHQAVLEAQKLAVSKSNFLSTMSHELRTPLNSVIGISELMIRDKPEERQKDNLRILHRSALDLLALINNILDFNKIDSEKMELESVNFRLAGFMQEICMGLKSRARDKQLEFVLDIDKQLDKVVVTSDPTRLSQLIYNLVGNAIKFTDKGSIVVKLEQIGNASNDVLLVQFAITDTGIGIAADRHEAIFEIFGQAESHTSRKYGGTGLGLAIVRQILALFKSSLQLQSSPGVGSTFSFIIPFTTTNEIVKEHLPEAEQTDLSHLRIMVAEDNDVNRLLLKKQLDMLHVQPVLVANGQQAYEAFLSQSFDAILMDLHMPVLDGYSATKKIRAYTDPAKAKTYIIAFTASVTEQEEITQTGFNDHLYKPVNMHDLREKLEKIAAMVEGKKV